MKMQRQKRRVRFVPECAGERASLGGRVEKLRDGARVRVGMGVPTTAAQENDPPRKPWTSASAGTDRMRCGAGSLARIPT